MLDYNDPEVIKAIAERSALNRQCPFQARVKDLRLGDTVRIFSMEYGTATVYQILETGDCKVWRPYVHTGDFRYSGNRIVPYVGMEDFTLYNDQTVTVLRVGSIKA